MLGKSRGIDMKIVRLVKEYLFVEVFIAVSFGALASVLGAIVEGIEEKVLSSNVIENFAKDYCRWLNFKFALVGIAVGIVAGILVIFLIDRLKNTRFGKWWISFADIQKDNKLFL